MDAIFSGVKCWVDGEFVDAALIVRGESVSVFPRVPDCGLPTFKMDNCVLLPGLADVHVHLREPGFSYKEDMASGTAAAARGGFTAVCAMPNLNPVPDCAENLRSQLEAIENKAIINVYPYGALTVGEKGEKMADMDSMATHVVAFSDDGKGVQSPDMMRRCMEKVKSLGKILAAHCEDESLLHGGCIHDGDYARGQGIPGICSESEWGPIARDVELLKETGCPYHVCHVSAKESVEVIRKAKAEGIDITCETGPHYLVFDDSQLQDSGRFRMNPPIRAKEDREALIAGLLDGTVDMIATDHAPHSGEEKAGGLRGSLNGVVGLETAFPVMYTHFVKPGILSLGKLVELMAIAPRRRFGLPLDSGDLCLYDLGAEYTVSSAEFASQGKSCPFEGMTVSGRCLMTAVKGKIVYNNFDI